MHISRQNVRNGKIWKTWHDKRWKSHFQICDQVQTKSQTAFLGVMETPKTPSLDIAAKDTTTPDTKPVEAEAKNSSAKKEEIAKKPEKRVRRKKKHPKDPKKPKRAKSGANMRADRTCNCR